MQDISCQVTWMKSKTCLRMRSIFSRIDRQTDRWKNSEWEKERKKYFKKIKERYNFRKKKLVSRYNIMRKKKKRWKNWSIGRIVVKFEMQDIFRFLSRQIASERKLLFSRFVGINYDLHIPENSNETFCKFLKKVQMHIRA